MAALSSRVEERRQRIVVEMIVVRRMGKES
jgi:hypothetical protein